MDRAFWLDRWDSGQIGFHQKDVNPRLLSFAAHLGESSNRVFVPLAGKSNDMAWLASRGHEVVGVELSELAVRAFYEEHSLTPEITKRGPVTRFRAGGVTLYCGDFFDLTKEELGDVAAVFDRAAYFALPEPLRERYAAHMAELLSPGTKVLLVTIAYDERLASGPPFSIANEKVSAALSPWFSLKELESVEIDIGNARLKAAGVSVTRETTWLLCRKG